MFQFEIKMVNYDSETTVAVMAYDMDVIFQGTAGFGVRYVNYFHVKSCLGSSVTGSHN